MMQTFSLCILGKGILKFYGGPPGTLCKIQFGKVCSDKIVANRCVTEPAEPRVNVSANTWPSDTYLSRSEIYTLASFQIKKKFLCA